MKTRTLSLLLFIAVILSPDRILAEDRHPKTFVGLGFGFSSLGMSADLHITQRYDRIVASVRYLRTQREVWPFAEPSVGAYDFNELGILVGYSFEGQRTLVTLEAGLGLTMGKRCYGERQTILGPEGEYETVEAVVGYLFGSQLHARITKHFGIGAYPYLNLNEHKNYGGVNLEILIGQL